MTGEISVSIRQAWDFSGYEIVFWERRGDKIAVVEPMELKFTETAEGAFLTQPSLRIPYHMAPGFFKALAEVMDKEGIKTENDHKIQGLLEATKFHLQDMRKLLKLEKS